MNDNVRCASCDIELGSDPITVDGVPFCCQGCAQGGPCLCTYQGSLAPYPGNGQRELWEILDIFGDRA